MSCYHMNVAFLEQYATIKKNNNRPGYKLKNLIFSNSPEFQGYEFYNKQNEILAKRKDPHIYKFIPCGKCIGCRTTERKNWALRLELEAKQYDHNYFLTLTYNEENIVIPDYKIAYTKYQSDTLPILYVKGYTNDGTWTGTVVKKHIQQFIKSLRTYFEREYNHQGLKFYAVSEYGEKGTHRPHYHIILLNCPNLDPELTLIGMNKKTKDPYYTHQRIEHIWGKGFITIGKVTWESISYTAGYCQKKLFGDKGKEINAENGKDPIFATMSRRPGIAKNWFNENKEKIMETDEIITSKGYSIKPPRYFDNLFDIGNDEEYAYIQMQKLKREFISKNELEKKLSQTNITYKEQLEIDEKTAQNKQKLYNRGRINENICR